MKARALRGATGLGYGLVIGLIGVVALSAINTIGEQSQAVMCQTADALSVAAGSRCSPTPDPSPDSLLNFTIPPVLSTAQGQSESDCMILRVQNLGADEYASGDLEFSIQGPDAADFTWCDDSGYSPLAYNFPSSSNEATATSNRTLSPGANSGLLVSVRMIRGHSGGSAPVETREATLVVTGADGMQGFESITGRAYNSAVPIAAFVGRTEGIVIGQAAAFLPVTTGCQGFTVYNIGNAAASTVTLTVSGPDADKVTTCVNGCTSGLAAGATCTYGVQIGPMEEVREHVFEVEADMDGISSATAYGVWTVTPFASVRGGNIGSGSFGGMNLGTITTDGTGPCLEFDAENGGLADQANFNPTFSGPGGGNITFTPCTASTNACSFPLSPDDPVCRLGLRPTYSGSTPFSGGAYVYSMRIGGSTTNTVYSVNIQ